MCPTWKTTRHSNGVIFRPKRQTSRRSSVEFYVWTAQTASGVPPKQKHQSMVLFLDSSGLQMRWLPLHALSCHPYPSISTTNGADKAFTSLYPWYRYPGMHALNYLRLPPLVRSVSLGETESRASSSFPWLAGVQGAQPRVDIRRAQQPMTAGSRCPGLMRRDVEE